MNLFLNHNYWIDFLDHKLLTICRADSQEYVTNLVLRDKKFELLFASKEIDKNIDQFSKEIMKKGINHFYDEILIFLKQKTLKLDPQFSKFAYYSLSNIPTNDWKYHSPIIILLKTLNSTSGKEYCFQNGLKHAELKEKILSQLHIYHLLLITDKEAAYKFITQNMC